MKNKKKIVIGLFLATMCVLMFSGNNSAVADTVAITLSQPTIWTDGSPMTVPLGTTLYYGMQSGIYNTSVDIGSSLSYAANVQCGVNYYFAGQAYVVSNPSDTSAFSNELVKQVACPPPSCVYTYSNWGVCQSNGTQTRTILSTAPAGCVGTPLSLTESCTNVPPTCSSFTYSAWGSCQSNNTQTRTVLTSTPTGCTGGLPNTSQSCTYVPPTCSSFTYSAWGSCQSNNTQTRTVLTSTPTGCTGGLPNTSQSCAYVPPANVSLTVRVHSQGTVTGNNINCGQGGSTCQGSYPSGTQITLTATPIKRNKFLGWSASVCSGMGSVCTFSLTNNSSITATFGR
jgi:hypothetical protein